MNLEVTSATTSKASVKNDQHVALRGNQILDLNLLFEHALE